MSNSCCPSSRSAIYDRVELLAEWQVIHDVHIHDMVDLVGEWLLVQVVILILYSSIERCFTISYI
jgi:hypothetical protein